VERRDVLAPPRFAGASSTAPGCGRPPEGRGGARFPLPDDHEDRGLYITEGAVEVAGEGFEAGRMMVFRPGDRITVKAGARLMALGGATMGGSRFIWWNFVASSRERIEAAKAEWRAARWCEGRFDLPAADHDEFIPLP
jgi:hypothetical protein